MSDLQESQAHGDLTTTEATNDSAAAPEAETQSTQQRPDAPAYPPNEADEPSQARLSQPPTYTDIRECLARAQRDAVDIAIAFTGMNMKESERFCRIKGLQPTNDPSEDWPSLFRQSLFETRPLPAFSTIMTPISIAKCLTPYETNYGLHPNFLESRTARREETAVFWAETLERSALKVNMDILDMAARSGLWHIKWETLVSQLAATSKWVYGSHSSAAPSRSQVKTAIAIFNDGERLRDIGTDADSDHLPSVERLCREFQVGSGRRLADYVRRGVGLPSTSS